MGVLLMAMTIGGLIAAAFLLAISLLTKKPWLTRFTLGGAAIWIGFYAAMLFGFSLASTEKTLALNEPKAFCGFYLDCHMHTVVSDVRIAKAIGSRTAAGEYYIIKIKVFSDAVRARLKLLTPDARVIDTSGRAYIRDEQAEAQLSQQPMFDKEIGPEESFEKEIVFDLPAGVRNPRLDITEGFGIDKFIETVLIGDEDSIFHKRNYFELKEQNDTAGL